jgi:hypothetical protein
LTKCYYMVSSCLYAADADFFFYFLVYEYIRIVSVINLRVSIYSVVIQYFILLCDYYDYTYLLKCVLVAPLMYVLLLVSLIDLKCLFIHVCSII